MSQAAWGSSPERIERVAFLVVANHLVMSHLSQRRDLSDPRLVSDFAKVVGDRTNLRNLYLVTVADIRASSKKAWTEWKGQLIHELFEKTAEFLEVGADDPNAAMELVEKRVTTRRESATAELRKQKVPDERIEQYFDSMPRRYFTAHSPSQIARHARVVLDYETEQLIGTAVRSFRGGFSEFILCARDVHGLFSNVAGVLTALHINILGAHVYTMRSGLALEVYRLTTPDGEKREQKLAWEELRRVLEEVVRGESTVDELLKRRGRPLGSAKPPAASPETVTVTNDESDFYTIADVAAHDRLGLLHDLTRVIADHGLEIYISKAGFVLDQVTDTFYLKTPDGKKILDPAVLTSLEGELLLAAQGPKADDG